MTGAANQSGEGVDSCLDIPSDVSVGALLRALGSDDRLALMREAATRDDEPGSRGGRSITDLARRTDLTRFTASRHLSMLEAVGLVRRRRDGVSSLFEVCPTALERVEDWLYEFLDALDSPVSPETVARPR